MPQPSRHGVEEPVAPPSLARTVESRAADTFLLRLGEALQRHGADADRLEEVVGSCARCLDVVTQVFSTPTSLFIAFGSDLNQRTHLVRVSPGDPDLGKLAELDAVVGCVLDGCLDAASALALLSEIAERPPRYGPRAVSLAFGLASASAVCFFGGGAADVVLTFVLGLLLGVLAHAASHRAAMRSVLEPVAALSVAVSAAVAARFTGVVHPDLVTLGALIVLVPGLTVTVAMRELATRHWVSGTARLAGAGAVFLTLGLGVALGQRLAQGGAGVVALDSSSALAVALPAWTQHVALVVAPLAFLVLFQARRRDALAVLVAGVVGFVGARTGAEFLGPELGAFVGALLIGLLGTADARLTGRPACVTQVPGIMLLVPGSVGFRSLTSFLDANATAGIDAAFRMGLVAIALVGGLLMAHALVPSRRPL